ncbi:MAG: HEAT repeat domain-containing protein [Leptolyngbyaceae cyanobacterium SU_3_3]|nr:HEAT repeat domain-containing protein [Leptolyngbyaceae cyanobacterium SU_3_3]NJR51088.1 HEAT repeat domain-containing protein [Leptolyngbyaceae cyanobacterium CSU_1_3]
MASLLGALVLRGRKAAVLAPEGDGSIVEFRSRPEQPPGESLPLPETARRENGRVSVSTSEDLSDGMAVEGKAKGKAGFNGHSHSTIAISENPSPQVESALSHIAESPKVPETTKISETTRLAKINIVDELIRDLRTPDPVKRQKVIWELGQRGDTRAVQPMVDLMVDSDSKQRSLILSALSEIGTRTLKPLSRALAISLQDESADVRKNAIRDLTRVYDMVAQISHLLHKATDDPDQDVQETARWALGQLNRIRTAPGVDNLPALKNSVSSPESLP